MYLKFVTVCFCFAISLIEHIVVAEKSKFIVYFHLYYNNLKNKLTTYQSYARAIVKV